jgi:prepilin-type N-terminal cleavage/methylation domain-containing protein
MLKRTAFTMIELIFVIVIMGILGKFGVEFIAQAYKSFIFSKINNNLQTNSASAVELIASRLQYRIKDSVIARNPTTFGFTPLSNSQDDNATILEWVGSFDEAFRGTLLPDWSGIIDLDDSNASVLVSPKTDTGKLNALIHTLSYGATNINTAAIYFIGSTNDINGWGWNGAVLPNQHNTIHPIHVGANSNEFISGIPLPGVNFSGVEAFEYYKLAWSAFAVGIDDWNATSQTGTLKLWYSYQPWFGDRYDVDGRSAIIAENVSAFRFRSSGSLVKIQVCSKSNLTNEEYSICKEKTIY